MHGRSKICFPSAEDLCASRLSLPSVNLVSVVVVTTRSIGNRSVNVISRNEYVKSGDGKH